MINLGGPLNVAGGGTGEAGAGWTAFGPALVAVGGSGASFSATAGDYQLIGKTLHFHVQFITSYTTAPTSISLNLPASLSARNANMFAGTNVNLGTAVVAYVAAATNTAKITGYAGGSPFTASGQSLVLNGTVEVQ